MTPKILTTLKSYDRHTFMGDLFAGVTVALVALPLSLAIAIASGASPGQGLVTAIVGGFLISLLGGSRVQIGGPTGAFIVVVYGIIAEHGYDGLVLATFMAGLILIIGGISQLGRLVRHVPAAVINGFTIGIGIIIATSQIKDFFGLSAEHLPAEFLEKVPALWAARDSVNWGAAGIALASMVLIVGLRKLAPRLPGLIVAVAATSAVVAIFGLDVETIASRFGALPGALPHPHIPAFSWDRVEELLPSAFVIAFLAAIESLLSATVADRMINAHHRTGAELIAEGVANTSSACFGGLPVTGAIARTATNVNAGGRTPVAGLVHAATILLIVLFASDWAAKLALPAMAALLMLTAWNMTEPHKWRSYAKAPKPDLLLLLLTMLLTVLVDLSVAIGVGVVIGLGLKLREKDRQLRKLRGDQTR
ncbi:MAG: SulP family inorganic anion transporter [Brevirhabdus sp.]